VTKIPDKPQLEQLGEFVQSVSFDYLSPEIVDRLKLHLLDSIGCALGAINGPPIKILRESIMQLGGSPQVGIPGVISRSSVDRGAQYMTALIRYLDFMDNFLATHGTCHPSDNIGSLLAVSELCDLKGKDFLAAMAVAYNVQCRMIDVEPSMEKGFDHTTQLGYSIAAGVSKILRLDATQIKNAISISGSTFNPLVVTRAPHTSNWKGLLSSHIALGTVNCCLLAQKGMTGPQDVFEGEGGYNQDYKIKHPPDWNDFRVDLYERLVLKKYNAEVHTQSVIEACMALKEEKNLRTEEIAGIDARVFQTAYDITGGGKYGPRKQVATKEEADHSMPYLIAVALIDGRVSPAQFAPERINKPDVQELLQKVKVNTKFHLSKPKKLAEKIDPYTRHYPGKMLSSVAIHMSSGEKYQKEVSEFRGFHTDKATWNDVVEKFHSLAEGIPKSSKVQIIDLVQNVEDFKISQLMSLIATACTAQQLK
jgi:2-methylcitrate dehydratase